jgi:hypothetical protein
MSLGDDVDIPKERAYVNENPPRIEIFRDSAKKKESERHAFKVHKWLATSSGYPCYHQTNNSNSLSS